MGPSAFVSILARKTRRVYRRQHVAVDQLVVVKLLQKLWGSSPSGSRMFLFGAGAFRAHWDAVIARLELEADPCERRIMPGGLRGSEATALYRATGDVQ